MSNIDPDDEEDFANFTDEFCMSLQNKGVADMPTQAAIEQYFNEGFSAEYAVTMFLEDSGL